MVKNWLSLVKFSHTIFALPFALIGFFLAVKEFGKEEIVSGSGDPVFNNIIITKYPNYVVLFILVLLCMVFARSAAMAFNRYLDRDIDALNPRTASREIPAGILSKNSALIFTICCCVLFVACTWFINTICFLLSPVALFVILFYSYTKRFTALCHLVLGLGLSLAPIGAYLAVKGSFDLLPLIFSFIVLFWVSGFDIIYASQDESFDKSQNLYSIPSITGVSRALNISILLHVLCAALVVFAGVYGNFGFAYWVGALLFCGMLYYQHSIVSAKDLSRVGLAFMTANGIASVVFAALVILDLFL